MASKVQKPCKICGKMFFPCADCENDKTMFRWKKVACSPECAKEYFAKIEISRRLKVESTESQTAETGNVESGVATKNTKSRRTRKKNNKSEESEQIE